MTQCLTVLVSLTSLVLTVHFHNMYVAGRSNDADVMERGVDYLQFTVTSRTEMPNEEFAEEISRAAEDLYAGEVPKWRLSR